MTLARFLTGMAFAAAASAALGQGPGSRLLIGSPPLRPAGPPPRAADDARAARKPLDASACDKLHGAARGRCLLEVREVAKGEASAGPASAGAAAGGTTPR